MLSKWKESLRGGHSHLCNMSGLQLSGLTCRHVTQTASLIHDMAASGWWPCPVNVTVLCRNLAAQCRTGMVTEHQMPVMPSGYTTMSLSQNWIMDKITQILVNLESGLVVVTLRDPFAGPHLQKLEEIKPEGAQANSAQGSEIKQPLEFTLHHFSELCLYPGL